MKAEERKREKYLPTLLVQQIRLQWYKDCRGGNAAAQRNQYPRAMRLPKDFFSYYSFGLPTHFISILQRPDGFQIDKDCRRLMEWKPNGTMRLHPFELIQLESGIPVSYTHLQTWLMGSWNCGVFTHWEIAQRLMDAFTGLKLKELEWFENPREKTLKNGKPRARRAKWLPEREADLVYLYADHYIDARNPTPAETDFFTVTRMDAWGVSTWFMCTPQAAEKLIAMDYDNLAVKETTIVG